MKNLRTSTELRLFFLILLFTLPVLAGCGGGINYSGLRDYLHDPNYPQEFFETATPEDVGLDSNVLDLCANAQNSYGIHSMLVIRNDKLVFERYGDGIVNGVYLYGADFTNGVQHQFTPDDTHNIQCSTKSIISALVGIAINEGTIHLDDPVVPYFTDTVIKNMSPAKSRITIEDLLTMRSGTQWISDDTPMLNSDEAGVYALNMPMAHEPGTYFQYNSSDPCIINSIIYRTTGKIPEDYAREKLFGPLGINDFHWVTDHSGINIAYGLYMRPRDMAKFGYLYLKQGIWNGVQVVPASWVTTSTQDHVGTTKYGYYWWMEFPGGYNTSGLGSQFIFVFPDKNLVIVFTANLASDNYACENAVQRILDSIH